MNLPETAKLLKVSVETVRKYIRQGRLTDLNADKGKYHRVDIALGEVIHFQPRPTGRPGGKKDANITRPFRKRRRLSSRASQVRTQFERLFTRGYEVPIRKGLVG